MSVNILCIGDIVGRPGRMVVADKLPGFIEERQVDFVVANAENAAGGSGLTPQIIKKLHRYGVDAITLGDHVFRKREVIQAMEKSERIVRPVNLLPTAPGKKWIVAPTKDNRHQVAVTCALGQMYMGNWNSPWPLVTRTMEEIPAEVRIRVVDFHAEASSEKIAMGWHLSGKASVVFGTHTHIPTADARVLDGGTAYISDVGMTGPYDSVLGRRKDRVLSFLTTGLPARFDIAEGDPRMCGVLATIDPASGKAMSVERVEVAGRVAEGGAYDADDGRGKK